jgi:hypothetical protein
MKLYQLWQFSKYQMIVYMAEQMLAHFTSKSKVLLTRHFCTRQTVPTHATAVALPQPTDHHVSHRAHKHCPVYTRYYDLDGQGIRVRFLGGSRDYCDSHKVQTGSEAHPASCSVGARALSPWVTLLGHEADHSLLPGAEVKNMWNYTSIPQYVFMMCCLIKYRDNSTLFLLSVDMRYHLLRREH